ncbi:hypothetical protein WG66_003436 [Moniliophthora roreri]|nr:hypothetical protein WG66_003436 [Moniliophthora roreri]
MNSDQELLIQGQVQATAKQDRRKTSFGGPSAPRMFRTARSPTRTDSNTYSDDSYEDSNSIDEVEATLNNLDDELDDTEQALSTWSSSTPDQTRSYYSSTGYGTYTGTGTGSYSYSATQSGYTGSPSFVSLPGLLNPSSPSTHSRNYPPASNDPRIRLSHITERTEGTESRPVSGVSQATTIPARPRSAFISSGHGRHSTDPSADRDLPPPGRANELIGLFEATSSGSRPNSPTKPLTSTSYTRSQTPTTTLSSLMSPPLRPSTAAGTSTYTGSAFAPNTLSSSAFTPSATQTGTGTGTYTNTGTYTTGTYTSTDTYTATGTSRSPERTPTSTLRRPQQSSPRSPLSSVRNIVALWKERTPTKGHARGTSVSSGSVSPTQESRHLRQRSEPAPRPDEGDDLFSLRRRASGRSSGEPGDRGSGASANGLGVDVGELSKFLGGGGTEKPIHLGTLYYLNVHTSPPFLWQKCTALLYRHTLLLSWLAPTAAGERAPMGRAVVQLDLINCLTAESALTLSHPRARDDVGAIAARQQDARDGVSDMDGLVHSLVPFWMVYGDGVERLACESLVERQRWLGRIWEAINNPPTPSLSRAPSLTPSFARSRSPAGSIRTIQSVESRSTASSASSSASAGSRSTVFIPHIADVPEMSGIDDMYASESDRGRGSPKKTPSSSGSSNGKYVSFSDQDTDIVSRRPSTFMSSHHSRTVDDTVISGDDYIYPGDSRAIRGRRTSTRLRRSGSMTDLGSDFQSNRRYVGSSAEEEDDQFFTAGSSTQQSSAYSTADSYDPTRSYTTYSGDYTGTYTDTYTGTSGWTPRTRALSETTGYTGYTRGGTGTYTDSRTGTGAFSGLTPSDTRGGTTLSYRGTESASFLGDSHDGTGSYTGSPYTRTGTFSGTGTYTDTYTGSPYTATMSYTSSPYTRTGTFTSSSYAPTSPGQTPLSRTREVRRRTRRSSYSNSSSGRSGTGSGSGYQPSASDESSDKENEGSISGATPGDEYGRGGSHIGSGSSGPLSGTRSSETGYDICPSSDISTLERQTMTYTTTTYTDETSPSSSGTESSTDKEESSDEKFQTASQGSTSDEYATAKSPSIASLGVESLTRIPSIYSSASEGSARYKTASELSSERSILIPGVAPPPGALGHTPGRQQQPAGAAPAPQLQYVPMPQAPITVPGMDDLLAAVRNTQLTTLANEAQTRELLRYMAQLNEWLDRDVRDRQAELRGVIANIEALRNQIASLGRGAPGEVPSESESSSSEDEGTPRVVYGQPPTMPMPIPGVPSQFPPGFVPQDEGPVIPPRMPDQGEGGVVPPVVPMGMPTPSGVPPAPIIINQPGQPGQFGPVGPPPVIPMDGFGAPGTGPMPMPVPQTVPVAEGPFIPPYEGGQPTVIQMQGSPSGSGDSSTSSSRSSSRSPSPRSRRRSSRSRSPRSLRDARHGSPTPIPVPPSVIRHDTGGPPIVTVPVPSYVPSELRSHTPRHPDAPSQAAGPTIINIPPQQVQQPGVPAGGIFPAPTVPGAVYPLPPAIIPSQPPGTVVVRTGGSPSSSSSSSRSRSPSRSRRGDSRRSSRRGGSRRSRSYSRSYSRSRSRSPQIIRVDSRSSRRTRSPTQVPPPVGQIIIPPAGTHSRRPSRSRSRSRSPIIIQRTGSSRRHESRRGSPPPQPVYIPTQPPIPQGQPPTVVVQQPRNRSRSSSRSSGRRTPIIVPVGTQPSQPPVIIPGSTGYAPTPGFPQPVPLTGVPITGVPITGVPITGVPPTGVPPTIVPSVYPGPPRTYRSRSRSPSRSRSRTPPSRRPTQRSDTQPVVVIPSGSYTDPARGAPYDPSQSRAGQRPPTRITRSPSPEYEDHRVPSHAPSRRTSRPYSPEYSRYGSRSPSRRDRPGRRDRSRDRYERRRRSRSYDSDRYGRRHSRDRYGRPYDDYRAGESRRRPRSRSGSPRGRSYSRSPSRYSRRPGSPRSHRTRTHRSPSYAGTQVIPVPPPIPGTHLSRAPTPIHYERPEGVPTIVPTHAEEHEIPRHSTYAPTHGIPPSVAPAGSVYEAPRTATHPPGSVYEAPHSPPPAVLSRHPTGRTERSVRYEDEFARPEIRSLSSEAETVAHAPGAVPPRTTATPVSYPPRTTATPVSYPPRTTATPVADLAREEADRERLARLDDVENQLRHVSESAQQAEDIREEDFRRNEEDRQRLFLEQEERRDQLAAEARNALMEQATRFLEAAVPPAPPPALPVEEPLPVPPPVVPEELAPVPPSDVLSDRQSAVIQDVASQHAREIREVIDMEREEMAREREAAEAERQRLEQEKATAQVAADEQRDARIRELEEELARVRAELEDEKRQREEEKHQREIEDADLREREKAEREEQNESLRAQLGDITNLVNEQRGLYEEKKRIMDERHEDKIERRARKDEDMMNLMSMMNKMQEDMQRDRERAEEVRAAAEQRPGFEQVIAELERQNAQQRELLQQLSNDWRADCERHHQETLDAVRETADEQVPFNIQGYLDDFSKALATEVRILLGEVGKLREERRGLQHEIGYLLCIRSKYGPGGEFEPDWKPAPGQPGGPPVDEPPAPPPEPPAPPEIPAARPGWRNVYPRASRKKKKEAAAAAAAASAPPPQPDPRAQTRSWATWQPDPHFVPTPPSVEPTLLVPEASSPVVLCVVSVEYDVASEELTGERLFHGCPLSTLWPCLSTLSDMEYDAQKTIMISTASPLLTLRINNIYIIHLLDPWTTVALVQSNLAIMSQEECAPVEQ